MLGPSRDHWGRRLNLCRLLLTANQMCTHAKETDQTVARETQDGSAFLLRISSETCLRPRLEVARIPKECATQPVGFSNNPEPVPKLSRTAEALEVMTPTCSGSQLSFISTIAYLCVLSTMVIENHPAQSDKYEHFIQNK